jgi:hypothetical protein
MSQRKFSIVDAFPQPHAATPLLMFRLRIDESDDTPIHAMALRCQIQIEPRQRRYDSGEEGKLIELFAEPARWGDTLRSLLWTHVAVMVPGFCGSTEIDLPVPCTYDFDVVASKYLHALDNGDVPLLFLFNGTVFSRGTNGFSVEQISWENEASYRLPVRVWRDLMDRYFPASAWIRLRRDSFDALYGYKCRRALTSWEDAIDALLEESRPEKPL